MTEAEWIAGRPAPELVDHLTRRKPRRPDDRKFRLLMCGACRLIWDQLPDAASREAVEAAELLADGLTTDETVRQVDVALRDSGVIGLARAAIIWASWGPWRGYGSIGIAVTTVTTFITRVGPKRHAPLASLVRCIAGNPFRPVAFDPAWRTATAVELARGIYEERAFDRLPILADALQDAGCDNEDVLNHCRRDPTHARGCWVVDGVLGKA